MRTLGLLLVGIAGDRRLKYVPAYVSLNCSSENKHFWNENRRSVDNFSFLQKGILQTR